MTPKQKAFVTEYLRDKNGTQAAIRAGYSKKTARAIAHELLTKPDIAQAVEAKQERAAERAELTLESHINTLAELRDAAVAKEQYGAAINAEVKRGEVSGFYVKRTEDVTGLTRDQKRERLLKLLA